MGLKYNDIYHFLDFGFYQSIDFKSIKFYIFSYKNSLKSIAYDFPIFFINSLSSFESEFKLFFVASLSFFLFVKEE